MKEKTNSNQKSIFRTKNDFIGKLNSFNYYLKLFSFLSFLILVSCQKIELVDKNDTVQNVNPEQSANVIPPAVNGVMMQGFYWESPRNTPGIGSYYQVLASQAASLRTAGITAMWLPPAYKGSGVEDVGYGVYDRYDLGEFNQKGTIATKYGTIAQMDGAITALHNNGIAVYEDIVMNHLVFADRQETRNGQQVWTAFDYTPRNNTYSAFKWNASLMNGWQGSAGWVQWSAWDFNPYNNGDAYDNLLGCEIKYNPINGAGATETINWGRWITTRMKLDGYRLDATKHIWTPFVNSWLDNVKGTRFAVSEAWMRNKDELNAYAGATGGRTSLFDVPLHYTFVDMSGGNGNWDMRGLQDAGFTPMNPTLSVTFVDNHDTEHSTGALYSPVVNFKMFAYAYILTREQGYPCVFYKDYYVYNLKPEIDRLMQIRRENGFGGGFEYRGAGENDQDVYMYSRAGNATNRGLLLMLNDGNTSRSKTITTPFRNATLTDKTGRTAGTVTTDANGRGTFTVNARNYAVWVPNSAVTNTPPVLSISPAAGAVNNGTVVTLSATDNSGVPPTIFFTTDGSTPTTSSSSATGSTTFTISAATTIRAFARDNQNLSSAVNSYAYTVNPTGGGGTTAVTFNINYSNTVEGQDVYIVGNTAQLGAWNTANAIKLSGNAWPTWRTTINLTSGTQVQYKYFRRTGTNASTVLWEGGNNRIYTPTGATQNRTDTWQ